MRSRCGSRWHPTKVFLTRKCLQGQLSGWAISKMVKSPRLAPQRPAVLTKRARQQQWILQKLCWKFPPSSPEHLFYMCWTDLLCLLSSNVRVNPSSPREWRDTREVSIKLCAGRIKDNSLSNCRPLKLNTFFQICSHTAIHSQNVTRLWPRLTFTASYQDISDEKIVKKTYSV